MRGERVYLINDRFDLCAFTVSKVGFESKTKSGDDEQLEKYRTGLTEFSGLTGLVKINPAHPVNPVCFSSLHLHDPKLNPPLPLD